MTESEPLRFRHDPDVCVDLRLALSESPAEFPSEAELGKLRLTLAAQVGEPKRLRSESSAPPNLAAALGSLPGELPSAEQLRALRARLPGSSSVTAPLTRRPRLTKPKAKRKVVTALAWLLPAAAAAMSGAYWATHQEPEPAPAPSLPRQLPAPSIAPKVPELVAAPSASGESVPAPSSSASNIKRAPSPSVVHSDPEAELRLMREAQAALGSNPARALELAAQHAQQFPRGVLAQEREVVSIDALSRLGRTTEARSRATRFRKSHPESAYLPRIDRLVGAAPTAADSAKPAGSSLR
ncbi:MAG: hypothetical protein ACOY0T_18545 [Myxococcota bacterium]